MKARRFAASGNALMEYAVPTAILIIGAGVLTTVMDTQRLMGEYFLSASGNTSGSLNGTTFEAAPVAQTAGGSMGTGSGGFSTPFATVTDGAGGPARIILPAVTLSSSAAASGETTIVSAAGGLTSSEAADAPATSTSPVNSTPVLVTPVPSTTVAPNAAF